MGCQWRISGLGGVTNVGGVCVFIWQAGRLDWTVFCRLNTTFTLAARKLHELYQFNEGWQLNSSVLRGRDWESMRTLESWWQREREFRDSFTLNERKSYFNPQLLCSFDDKSCEVMCQHDTMYRWFVSIDYNVSNKLKLCAEGHELFSSVVDAFFKGFKYICLL